MLRDVLVWDPLKLDPHGSGFHALYGLATSILPKAELSIIACQFVLSILCIPLTYFVARFWLRNRSWAIWSAAIVAVMPINVFFATTEVRLLPGTFFMLLALAGLGVAIRDRHPLTMFASVLLGIVATQFYPILMFLPVPLMLLLFSSQTGRRLFRSGWAWAAMLVFLVLWLVPAVWMISLVSSKEGTVVGSGFLIAFSQLGLLFRPSFSFEGWQTYNIFLNTNFTPPALPLLMILGLVVGSIRKDTRIAALSVLACALIFTIPGLFPGRMNLARLQQAAQPFYAILVGVGIGWCVQRISRLLKRFSAGGVVFGVLVLLGSVAIWPGPIGSYYTLQLERRFFLDAIQRLDEGSRVIWAPSIKGINHSGLPSYLAEERGRDIDWGALESNVVPTELLTAADSSLYYYRASTCYTEMQDESRGDPLRPICVEIERQMELEEVFVGDIPSIPDDMAEYKGEEINIGSYRVKSIRKLQEKPEIFGKEKVPKIDSERFQSEQISLLARRSDEQPGLMGRLFSNSKFFLQLVLIAGVCLLLSRFRFLARLAGNVTRNEWFFLAFWTTAGAVLRILGGVRVPGFTSCVGYAHGYSVLRDVLVSDPRMLDPHGSGFHALHGLTTSILPNCELSIVTVQFILSVLCIPLSYFVARFWSKNRSWALWTAAVMAVMPVQVFFATTEVRTLPGVFFMLVTLACTGIAIRDKKPVTLFATALFGAVCTQFYPTLMLLPAVVFAFIIASRAGRALLRSGWTWAAATLFTTIWFVHLISVVSHVFGQESEKIGSAFVNAMLKFPLFFMPSQSFAGCDTYSVFLNHNFTPLVFGVLAVLGIIIGCFRKKSRIVTLSILAFAFLFTIVGLIPGRITPARLQLAAMPYYAMLAGIGTCWIVERIRLLTGRFSSVSVLAGAAILFGSIAIWPGTIGMHYVHQNERNFFIEALDHLKDGCSVVWAPSVDGTNYTIFLHI
ncbi:MAG: glycosyltransferase family 39 protein [Deltaproteobacteria bacterium]|nr:glycosyltransferase family 39 protein [Deltaproteobacteria bacterium]